MSPETIAAPDADATALIEALGSQMARELGPLTGLLREHHYELTEAEADADLILVNTCAIREKAEDKVFSKLGRLAELKVARPGLMVGVMGCMAQLHKDEIQRRAPHVDLVFGSPAIARVAELVERVRREGRRVLDTSEGPLVKITAKPASASRLKAYVTVMEGCEKHCTFCVVPTTRGRERSHTIGAIVAEAAAGSTATLDRLHALQAPAKLPKVVKVPSKAA
jgi:tRNA-2-methylthio-N6-dimethylallyladenosine synthase